MLGQKIMNDESERCIKFLFDLIHSFFTLSFLLFLYNFSLFLSIYFLRISFPRMSPFSVSLAQSALSQSVPFLKVPFSQTESSFPIESPIPFYLSITKSRPFLSQRRLLSLSLSLSFVTRVINTYRFNIGTLR